MADFLLSVGVDVSLSYEQMQKDISTLVSQLNNNPPKIEVDFDINKTTLTNLQSQINDICKKLDTTAAVKVTAGGSGQTVVQETAAINANTQAKKNNADATARKTQADANDIATTRQKNNAQKAYLNTIIRIESAIEKWTKAEHSKNATSRESYRSLKDQAEILRNAYSAYSQNINPTIKDVDKLTRATSRADIVFKNTESVLKANGDATKTWSQRIGSLSAKFGTWFSITRVIMAGYRAIRQMVSAVIELDTAMTELKKVTDETDSTYNKFLEKATSRAKELGASLSDVVTASADFARLGFNISEAEGLADAAIVYKNVGDGIEDISDASESIIATMQAFGVEATDVMTIVDKFNEVGNNYAISSKGVGDALLRSAAAMHAANNSLDETIALATASNTIVQDPEKVGTVLKTVSMYLRAAKTEAEDAGESTDGMASSVSKLREEILALTGNKVDIQIDEDTFKSTYQILKELSGVWGELTDISKANILEMVGGKRNSNVVAALLENFTIAEKALETSADSTGSALAENEKYLDSIQGKIQQFKASFQDLSQGLIDSESVKQIVELGTGLINCLGIIGEVVEALGGLNSILIMIGGSIAILKFESIIGLMTKIKDAVSLAGTAIGVFGLQVKETFSVSRAAGMGTFKSALTGIKAGFDEVSLSASTAQLAVAAFVAAIAIINLVKSSIENARQAVIAEAEAEIESASAIIEKTNALSEAYLEYSQYAEIANRTPEEEQNFQNALKQVTEAIGDKTTALRGLKEGTEEYTDALKKQVQEELKDAENKAKQARKAASDKLKATAYSNWDGSQIDFEYSNDAKTDETSKQVRSLIDKVMSDEFKVSKTYSGGGFGATAYKLDANAQDPDSVVKYYYELLELKDKLTEADLMETDAYNGVASTLQTLTNAVEEYVKAKYNEEAAVYKNANGIPETVAEYDKYRKYLIDSLSEDFNLPNDIVTSLVDGQLEVEGLAKKFSLVKNNVTDAKNSVKSFADSLSGIQSLSDGLEQLDKIYADIINGEDFDFSSIIGNEDFEKKFGDLGDAYDNFIKTISGNSGDIKACQQAFNDLTTEYIIQSGVLSDVTDETRNATVTMLEQMGVANAAVIVDAQLALNKEKLAIASKDLSNVTIDEINATLNSKDASETAKMALAQLWLQKLNLNSTKLDFNSDIDQIINIANAAGAGAAALAKLEQAKGIVQRANAEAAKGTVAGFHMIDSQEYADAQEVLKQVANGTFDYKFNILNSSDFKSKTYYSGGSATKSAQSAASKAAEKAVEKQKTWFELQLSEHKHRVAMEQETEENYLKWLNTAYQRAYSENIIEIDDYYKYQEEVFEGLRDLVRDYLNDVEHEISMRENYDGESKNIILLYEDLIKRVEKEISAARAQGLDDTDDYIQELQDKWQDYTNAIKDIREEIEEAAKDALDELIDYRVDMLKQEIEDEKDALNKKLDNLKEFYDKQKKMLQDKYDEEKYLEDQAEKRKSVTDIKAELDMLSNDDSAWAQKRKLELTEELNEAEKDLADFEKENALDKALDAIDEAYNSQEAQLQREMDALDERLNDPNALFNQALEDIKNNSKNQLYYQMLMYNRQYGDGNDETVKALWEETYGALNDYEKLFGELYKGVSLKNETGVKDEKGWDDAKVSGTNPANTPKETPKPTTTTTTTSTAPSLSSGSTVTIKKSATHFGSKSKSAKMASFVPGGSYTVYQTSGNQVLIGRNGVYTGWVNKSDIVGYASGTKHASAGLHELYEQGAETLFVSSSGNKYRMLEDGDKVLNAKATDFLYDFANSEGSVLAKMLKNVLSGTIFDNITPAIVNNEISMGDIIVQGSATHQTVSEIRRAQRENVDFMLKEFTKLNK